MARLVHSPLQQRVRQVRLRLIAQGLLNRLAVAWGIALAIGIAWMLAEPLAVPGAKPWLKWAVLTGVAGVATGIALWLTRRKAPSPVQAALTLDQRFDLSERTTTAWSLGPYEQAMPAGQALLADANAQLEKVRVRDKFPIRASWRVVFVPLLAVGVAVLSLYPLPVKRLLAEVTGSPETEEEKVEEKPTAAKPATPRTYIKPPPERPGKSIELQKLEAELERLYTEHNKDGGPEKERPEIVRDRQEKIANAEEQLKKREQELNEKFQKLQEQMEKATELEKGEARKDGPAKDFEEALSKGDLKKAEEEADRLRKKAKEKKLDQKDTEQLKKQIDEMQDKLDRLTREREKKKQELKERIDQAKRENRDAETLERELKQMEKDQEVPQEMKDIAKAMAKAKEALEMNDFDGLSEQFGEMAKQLGNIQEQLQDLESIEEHLQNLKQMKRQGCKECEGKGDKKGEGGEKDNAQGYAEGASGRRPENKDAKTKAGEEERVRGFFDPKGRKTYGGATNGPAFKKATSVEMAGEIQAAVQEAPDAVEVQRLPKATKDLVKDYFEKLGGQAPPPAPKK